ncbi:hypothetical protein J4211_00290 [Candidatus Woesearchaeota archaeon]|nr:hypothetical protein [Candidatus Woesearchaeota archaeon]
MNKKQELNENREVTISNKPYRVENFFQIIPSGEQGMFPTGSPVQAAAAVMVGVPYKGVEGEPLKYQFVEKASDGQDGVILTNTHNKDGDVYLSVITTVPQEKGIENEKQEEKNAEQETEES